MMISVIIMIYNFDSLIFQILSITKCVDFQMLNILQEYSKKLIIKLLQHSETRISFSKKWVKCLKKIESVRNPEQLSMAIKQSKKRISERYGASKGAVFGNI